MTTGVLNSTEAKLKKLADKLRPNRNEQQQQSAAVDTVGKVLQNNKEIKVAEIWKCGSNGKNTGLSKTSDIDLVILLSPKQSMEGILKLLIKALKGSSTVTPSSSYRAIQVTIHGIEMDVLPTKYGIAEPLGRPQREKKLVSEIAGMGNKYSDTVRILKYWRDLDGKKPKKDNIPSFAFEIIVAFIFRKENPGTLNDALQSCFQYITESKLNNSLPLLDKNNTQILNYNFNFTKKKYIVDRAIFEKKKLIKNDLSFLGL